MVFRAGVDVGHLEVNVWLIAVGEPLPSDPGSPRLHRAGLLARYLRAAGHGVTWWSSTFDHQKKRLRAPGYIESPLADGSRLLLLHGRPYDQNISLARIRNHREIAAQFASLAPNQLPPDLVLCSYPTVELCEAAVQYGKARGIPIVLDIRDLWPDSFLDLVPAQLRQIARLPLHSMFEQSARTCAGASAILGLTDAFRDWGIARAGRRRNDHDATFPMAYPDELPDADNLILANLEWDRLGVSRERPIACFFGTFGRQFHLESVIHAARITRGSTPELLWVLCGHGDRFNHYRKLAEGLENVILPGWVNHAAIYTLMHRAKVGLAPYISTENFILNMPNKPIEYLSAGLPVISTIEGVIREKIVDAGAGICVPPGGASALAKVVSEVVMNRVRHAEMARAALEIYRTEYVADAVYASMIKHLERIQSHSSVG